MINGFTINILNQNEEEIIIRLFKDETLPNGISVTVPHTEHDYSSLRNFAQKDGFIGNGINADRELKITIFNESTEEKLSSKFITDKKIIIDGGTNNIQLIIPPQSETMFQLMPYFE